MSQHNLTCFSWLSSSSPTQVAWHSSMRSHTAAWQPPAIKYGSAQRRSTAAFSTLLSSAPQSLWLHLRCTQTRASNLPSPSQVPPNRLFSPSPLFQSLSLALSFSPPPQPENPLRIHNNGVIDWIKPYNVWWRGCSGEKSMGRCDFLSH